MRNVLFSLLLALALAGCSHSARPGCATVSGGPVLYQYASLAALMAGGYAGEATVADMAARGDFGLGTYHGLDGEMVVLDGVFYRADASLALSTPPPGTAVPFAALTFFSPDAEAQTPAQPDLAALTAWLDARLPQRAFAAVRVQGVFPGLTIRSVPGFAPPYPGLAEALKKQNTRTLTNAEGVLVGIRCPQETAGAAVPGWHFHFVDKERAVGGHVLAASVGEACAQWMSMTAVLMEMPRTPLDLKAAEVPGETAGKGGGK